MEKQQLKTNQSCVTEIYILFLISLLVNDFLTNPTPKLGTTILDSHLIYGTFSICISYLSLWSHYLHINLRTEV